MRDLYEDADSNLETKLDLPAEDLCFGITAIYCPLEANRHTSDQFLFQLFWTAFYLELFLFDLGLLGVIHREG
jgi:hypothetical protein